jgi:hypothetical protein
MGSHGRHPSLVGPWVSAQCVLKCLIIDLPFLSRVRSRSVRATQTGSGRIGGSGTRQPIGSGDGALGEGRADQIDDEDGGSREVHYKKMINIRQPKN